MEFAFSREEEAYQVEVRAFIERALPPERLARHLDLTDQNWADEEMERMSYLGTQIMGLHGTLMPTSPHAPQGGILPHKHLERVRSTISIGANEVQRNIIALRGLGPDAVAMRLTVSALTLCCAVLY
jgi:hypothetical protein